MDISVYIYIIDLKFTVCVPEVYPEGSLSQYFDLGPSFYFMEKNFLSFFSIQISTFHRIKTRT